MSARDRDVPAPPADVEIPLDSNLFLALCGCIGTIPPDEPEPLFSFRLRSLAVREAE